MLLRSAKGANPSLLCLQTEINLVNTRLSRMFTRSKRPGAMRDNPEELGSLASELNALENRLNPLYRDYIAKLAEIHAYNEVEQERDTWEEKLEIIASAKRNVHDLLQNLHLFLI